jgi:hypothetical protein
MEIPDQNGHRCSLKSATCSGPNWICFFRYKEIRSMRSCLSWGKNIVIAIFSFFFLVFGIETLVGAFYLKNPLEFIIYFFSSSLMVLISLVGIMYPAFQIHALFRHRKIEDDPE